MLYRGDCLEVLKQLEEATIDALITDPPAGISFMGKDWDTFSKTSAGGQSPANTCHAEPNNYFNTRGATQKESSKAREPFIASMTDSFKECLRVLKPGAHGLVWALPRTSHWTATALENAGFEIRDVITHLFGSGFPKSHNLGEGGGTALKPASEHWVLIRRPISEKTIAANVLKHGTGGINIDACRIDSVISDSEKRTSKAGLGIWNMGSGNHTSAGKDRHNPQGRFPANLVLDEEAAEMLDEQSGIREGGHYPKIGKVGIFGEADNYHGDNFRDKSGGASRFFYVAKASKKDRGEDNKHPTVKSTKLMEYLIKLITPPNGIILDPFMGSGSTGVAAKRLGFEFIGIEKDEEYFKIAEKRIECVN